MVSTVSGIILGWQPCLAWMPVLVMEQRNDPVAFDATAPMAFQGSDSNAVKTVFLDYISTNFYRNGPSLGLC